MIPYTTKEYGTRRIRWVYDECHDVRDRYVIDPLAGPKEQEQVTEQIEEELGKLASGEWVALGAIVEERVTCTCPDCNGWHETDSLWGIVIEPDDHKLEEFARLYEWIPEAVSS